MDQQEWRRDQENHGGGTRHITIERGFVRIVLSSGQRTRYHGR